MTRSQLLSEACDRCIKELYSFVYPRVEWKDFVEQNKVYSNKYSEWDEYIKAFLNKKEHPELWNPQKETHPDWEGKSIVDCIGPKPFEFYYIPKQIMEDICSSYVYAYKIDEHQNLLSTIDTLKEYLESPITKVGKEYTHPDDIISRIIDILNSSELGDILYDELVSMNVTNPSEILTDTTKVISDNIWKEVKSMLDKAATFYRWDAELSSFNMTVYLGCSPTNSKDLVIKNWKKYKGQDIEIDDKQIENEYYGEN